jgi:hypothetical protein
VDQEGQEMVAVMDVGVMAILEMVREEEVQVHVQATVMDHILVVLEPTVKFVSGITSREILQCRQVPVLIQFV